MSRIEPLKSWIVNRLGWKTDRKLLVIESDDWGAVRMASPGAFRRLQAKGYPVDECAYNRYDTLERAEDIAALSEVLSSFRDDPGRPALMTLNMIMANPDFPAIAADKFSEYHVEPFWQTLSRFGHETALDSYRQAHHAGVIHPQLHGREHTAWPRWLAALQDGDQRFLDAFEESMYVVHPGGATAGRRDCLDALGFAPEAPAFGPVAAGLKQAQALFEEFWGEASRSFIAACYVWHSAIEPVLSEMGVRYLQGTRVQRVPRRRADQPVGRKRHFTGQRNRLGQRYLVRNVDLEPSLSGDTRNCVDRALSQVNSAFRHNTPAIVCSHRLNYMGWLDAANRDRGLFALQEFLRSVQSRWPDVEFIGSAELGRLIEA